ncbi:hypothetical protein ACFPM0_04500 [Pseudonocardia sulfidoxydans]|uniref:hypothetical protein n=1 Tax=Pseudonocardia sulfidoxydans TaxID=54011 RepID=UPI00360BEB3C
MITYDTFVLRVGGRAVTNRLPRRTRAALRAAGPALVCSAPRHAPGASAAPI